MSDKITNENKGEDFSPPGAGRSFWRNRYKLEISRIHSGYAAWWRERSRLKAPERDANTTLRHGNKLGTAVLVCSLALSSAFWPAHPFSCHPTDLRTTNHTPACEAHGWYRAIGGRQ